MRPPHEALEFQTYFVCIYVDDLRGYEYRADGGVAWVQLECRGDSPDPASHGAWIRLSMV